MKKVLVIGLLLAVLALTVPVIAQDEVTFTWGTFGNPVSLDGQNTTDGVSFRVITQGCESLLKFTSDSAVPNLATSWETSEDGLTWIFQLQEGVTFHDGTPFNAEAVAWNFNRWAFTDHPAHYESFIFTYYEWLFGGYDDDSLIETAEATGEYEVTFTLRNPNGVFLTNMAVVMAAIHSPTAVEAAGSSYGEPEVGFVCTGPYEFTEWIPDQHTVLTRNADYWGDNPSNIDKIIFRVIPDNAVRYAALQAGEIDGTEQINVEDLEAVESSDDTYLMSRPPLNIMYTAFNYRIKELRDVRVRQAISMAFDREAIVEAFYPPGAVVAKTQVPPGLWGYNPDIPDPVYDPEGAMALLAEAGYPDGLSEMTILALDDAGNVTDEVEEVVPLTLWFQPVVRPYNPDGEAIGEAMASFLADIGIIVNLETRDWGDYLQLGRDGELFGIYQLGWSADTADPDNFTGTFFIPTDMPLNRSGWYANPELNDVLVQARQLSDQAEREPLYQLADQMLHDDVARLWIAHTGVPLAFRSCISGYQPHPLSEYYTNVTVDCD
jgi:peptide/nickel transport system substrate-binding protein